MNDAEPVPQPGGRFSILGTRVTAATFEGTLDWLGHMVSAGQSTFLSAANVYSVMLGFRDPSFRQLVNRAGYVMADGMPLVWGLRLLGQRAERVHGDDLFFAFCERHRKRRHYLVGGAAGQPEEVVEALRRRFRAIRIVGYRATPVRPIPPRESAEIVEEIGQLAAEVIWVGMGTPDQDLWMAAATDRVSAPMVGVGSSFDLLAGRTPPAPEWMKKSGLQWLFRLLHEPRRLWRRYLVYNPLFVWHFTWQLLGLRRVDDPTVESSAGESEGQ